MTIRTIPAAPSDRLKARVGKMPQACGERFQGELQAAYMGDDRVINVFGSIGEEWGWDEDGYGLTMCGTTLQQIDQFLNKMGAGPVTLNVNSPGGDMFEGLAIYNRLREHQGEVTVNVVGTAASAASIIAMAADILKMGKASFLMIHNTWTSFSGNRHDFAKMADAMLPFDQAMARIYADRTGQTEEVVMALMDGETWIDGAKAVADGFADALLGEDDTETLKASARRPKTLKMSAKADEDYSAAVAALQAATAAL